MKLDHKKLKSNTWYLSGDKESVDNNSLTRVIEYKRKTAGAYVSLNREQIKVHLPEGECIASKKIDGELQVLFWNGEDLWSVNSYGNVKAELPCFIELKAALLKAQYKQAVMAGELHVNEANGRKRIYDLLSALGSGKDGSDVHLSLFDLLELDNQSYEFKDYGEKCIKLKEISEGLHKVGLVSYRTLKSKAALMALFDEWMVENAEGMVVRGNFPRIYKIKPKHTIDAAVIGYSESEEKGKVRSLLLALMTEDDAFQVIGKAGSGLDEDHRVSFYEMLSKSHVGSDYTETDSNNVAFHMVRPELVVQVGCNDFMTEMSEQAINNPLLSITDGNYQFQSLVQGVSMLFPIFERIREDKKVNRQDIRWEQIEGAVTIIRKPVQKNLAELPKATIISREAFCKIFKGNTLVQKYVIWKTNKEDVDPRFSSYVFQYANFSPDRKDPLDREVIVSNNLAQLQAIKDSYITENVKKGWEKA